MCKTLGSTLSTRDKKGRGKLKKERKKCFQWYALQQPVVCYLNN
jgi:hypothetical protein